MKKEIMKRRKWKRENEKRKRPLIKDIPIASFSILPFLKEKQRLDFFFKKERTKAKPSKFETSFEINWCGVTKMSKLDPFTDSITSETATTYPLKINKMLLFF